MGTDPPGAGPCRGCAPRPGGRASPAPAPSRARARTAPGKDASTESKGPACGEAPGTAAGPPSGSATLPLPPPLPRAPTCGGRRRSPGGVRDVPDEQGGVGGPRVARHNRFLRCLRACPRPPGSLRFSLPPQQLSRPPARPPPLGLGPTSAQPQRRARRRGGRGGAARREPVRADRVGAGPEPRGSGEGAARGPEDPGEPRRGRCRGPRGSGKGAARESRGPKRFGERTERRPADRRDLRRRGRCERGSGTGRRGGSRVPRPSGDGAVLRSAGIRGGGGPGGWSPRDPGRGRLASECVRRVEARRVLGAEAELGVRESGERVSGVVGVGRGEDRAQLLNSWMATGAFIPASSAQDLVSCSYSRPFRPEPDKVFKL